MGMKRDVMMPAFLRPPPRAKVVEMTQSGRILAIGDIHGCRDVLRRLLEAVKPDADDTVIALGDYVDRGLDSRGVIDELITLESATRLVALRGNHDEMMRRARHDPVFHQIWLTMGGAPTLRSYGGNLRGVPEAHWRFLDEHCIYWHETDTHVFVHGHVDPELPMDKQDPGHLCWARLEGAEPHLSGKTVICGHTAQPSGRIADLGHTLCLDTACVHGLWLTCLDVGAGHMWQVNASGTVREEDLRR